MEKNVFKNKNEKLSKISNNKIVNLFLIVQAFHYDDKGRKIYDMKGAINNPVAPVVNTTKDNTGVKEELSYLKSRSNIDTESLSKTNLMSVKIEKSEVKLNKQESSSVFYCKTCNCTLQDNQAYLDHLNGKKHNQILGMNMKVEKVGVDKVREKLLSLKRKADKPLVPNKNNNN